MFGFILIPILLLDSVSSFEIIQGVSISQLYQNGLPKDCLEVYIKLDDTTKAKMLDASTKFITSGLLEGNFVDLGNFDECLDVHQEKNDINGKYCMATVDLNTLLNVLDKLDTIPILINKTRNKIENFEKSKMLNTQISSLLGLYTTFARFGVCVPNECKLDNFGPLKFDEEKCYTKTTNEDMDLFPFIVLLILYVFLLISITSTFYDLIISNLSTKPKHEIFVAFSMYTNGKKLLSTSSSASQLSCLHGLKVFSMIWVVLGHSYLNMLTTSIDNIFYINQWIDNPVNMLILSATVSVDTFFTIGGLLTVYVYMNSPSMRMKDSFKKIPLLYLHRYLRLTPAFAIMVLFYASGLVKYIGSGPKWYTLDSAIKNCQDNWWAALLYVQNYMDYSKMCVVQSWYLSADFQLFLISPFLLIPLKKYPKYVIPSLSFVALAGMAIPFSIGYTNKWTGIGLGSTTKQFADDYYFVTYARFSPYFIGMIAGYYIYKFKKESKLMKIQLGYVLILWLITFFGIFGCVFDGFKLIRETDNRWFDGIYMGLNRSAWSLSISLLIFLCSTGNGGPVQKFLSLPLFHIIAKLTYAMYLVHYIVILCVNGTSRTKLHFSNFHVFTYFLGYFSITLLVSVFYCLIFELPMITIERILFPVVRNKEKRELPK